MKFHITITDNETNETLLARDVDAILASIQSGENTGSLVLSECDFASMCAAICGLFDVENEIKTRNSVPYALAKAGYTLNNEKGE